MRRNSPSRPATSKPATRAPQRFAETSAPGEGECEGGAEGVQAGPAVRARQALAGLVPAGRKRRDMGGRAHRETPGRPRQARLARFAIGEGDGQRGRLRLDQPRHHAAERVEEEQPRAILDRRLGEDVVVEQPGEEAAQGLVRIGRHFTPPPCRWRRGP